MKLTKYQHACFTLEKDGSVLVVDPGNFSADFIAPDNVVGVVITHQHPDHFDKEQLAAVFAKNDAVLILGPPEVVDTIELENKQAVVAGESVTVGPFHVQFYGGIHATIHESRPAVQNVGIMIDDIVYYPGDSFTAPNQPVDVLALPAAAPWMKISEAMDFLADIKPRLAFPTHDAILSEQGMSLVDGILGAVADANNIAYTRLSESIDV